MPLRPVTPGKPNAISRALDSEYHGINPGAQEYVDVTPEMMDLVSPANLRPSLIDVPPVSPYTRAPSENTATYIDNNSRRPVLITVTPDEYPLFSGSLTMLAKRASSGTQSRRKRTRSGGLETEDWAAAGRAKEHAVDPRREAMERYVTGELTGRHELIQKFLEASDYSKDPAHIGLARMGNEGNMRANVSYLWTFIFEDVLTAVGSHRQWRTDQGKLALRALNKSLLIDHAGNRHIDRFRDMLQFCDEWNGYKIAILNRRIYEAKQAVAASEIGKQIVRRT